MSGRHQSTTFRALDPRRLLSLRGALADRDELTRHLAEQPVDPEADPEHFESVWERAPDILRPYLPCRFLRAAPARWAPLLAAALQQPPDDSFVDETLHELATRFELWAVPDAYGLMLYASPRYASRFGYTPPALPGADAWVAALGGEPDPDQQDLRLALRDVVHEPGDVRSIAGALALADALPEADFAVPHLVESFRVDPAHLLEIMGAIRDFYLRAAAEGLPVQVLWHANP